MIKITPRDAGALDRALQKLVDDAEQATMGAVKGLVGYALAYIVPRTPQWSGELVSQWRVVASGEAAPRYRPRGYKDSEEAPWPIPKDHDELDPYHAVRSPNDMAMLDAREQVEADLRNLVRTRGLLNGATIWLPYTLGGDEWDGMNAFRRATRHPGFAGALEKLDDNLRARYRKIDTSQAIYMLKNPIPWAQQDRAAQQSYRFGLGVRKDNRAKAVEEKRIQRVAAQAAEKYEAKRIRRAEKESLKGSQSVEIGGSRRRVIRGDEKLNTRKLQQKKPTPLPGISLLDQLSNASKRRK